MNRADETGQKNAGDSPARMLIVLTVTAVIVGAALAGFFQLVYPRIEANRIAAEKRAIFAVLEHARSYDVVERKIRTARGTETARIFIGRDEGGNIAGYAFVAEGPGFQGIIKMMVGLNIDRQTLSGMEVLDQVETPGLGNRITDEKFKAQFAGLAINPSIEYIKNRKPEKPNQIQAITGATISSKAVVNTLNDRIKEVVRVLAQEPAAVSGGDRGAGDGST